MKLKKVFSSKVIKKGNKLLKPFFLVAVFNCANTINIGIAQTSTDAYWGKIRKADKKVNGVKAVWNYESQDAPSGKNVDEDVYEKLASQERAKGKTEEQIKKTVALFREIDEIDSLGSTISGVLTCLRVNKEMRCDLISTPSQIKGRPKGQEKFHTIDYFDGTDAVALSGVGVAAPEIGEITRGRTEALSSTARHFAKQVFLLGAPVTSYFSNKDSVREGGDDTVVLEKKVEGIFPKIMRATISKKTWRPIKIEQIRAETKDGVVDSSFEASQFRQNVDGVWFPSQVDAHFYGIKEEDHYSLKSVVFNKSVDSNQLRVTNSPMMSDCRFGKCVTYRWESGILPSQEKIEKLQRGEIDPPAGTNTPGVNIPMAVPILAMFLLCLGGGILTTDARKSKHKDKGQ